MTINPSEVWPLIAIMGVGVGALWWLWNRIYRVEVDASKSIDDAKGAIQPDVKNLKDSFQAYKLHVAETYVPNIAMRDMKDEIMGAVKDLKTDIKGSLGHMGDRLDHMGDRIDRLSQEPPKAKLTTSRLGE